MLRLLAEQSAILDTETLQNLDSPATDLLKSTFDVQVHTGLALLLLHALTWLTTTRAGHTHRPTSRPKFALI